VRRQQLRVLIFGIAATAFGLVNLYLYFDAVAEGLGMSGVAIGGCPKRPIRPIDFHSL
jgi:hypothetical protein